MIETCGLPPFGVVRVLSTHQLSPANLSFAGRFSADGNEVFAGGLGSIYGSVDVNISLSRALIRTPVFDLVSNRRIVKIQNAHHDDVNSCCWADSASGNVLISGSDDGFIKVW